MLPRCRAPISTTRYAVSAVAREHGQWDAELVVEVPGRRDRRPDVAEDRGEVVLGAGLALRAGEREDRHAGQPVEHVPRQRAERRDGIGDDDGRRGGRPRAQHGGGAGRHARRRRTS